MKRLLAMSLGAILGIGGGLAVRPSAPDPQAEPPGPPPAEVALEVRIRTDCPEAAPVIDARDALLEAVAALDAELSILAE